MPHHVQVALLPTEFGEVRDIGIVGRIHDKGKIDLTEPRLGNLPGRVIECVTCIGKGAQGSHIGILADVPVAGAR